MAKKKEQPTKMLRVKLVRSVIGYQQDQRDTVRSLGIRKMQQTVEVPDNPVMRGMINKVIHLVSVEEVE
jgi:large subunit ribosomal protein L30